MPGHTTETPAGKGPTDGADPAALLPVPDALAIVLTHATPLPARSVLLTEALGLILAEDVAAAEPMPPFAASFKDGYAVIASDGPGDYPLVGEVTAGRVADFRLEPGTVAYITTGAPLPPGADAVVMVERTERLDGGARPRVRIHERARPGQEIRPIGFDAGQGEVVLRAGEHLGPAEIGLAAAVGVTTVQAHARPRVAVLSTGDELAAPGAAPAPGQIRDSNGPALRAAVAAAGAMPVDLGIAGDSYAALSAAFDRGLAGADVLITSGGVSMGELDLMKKLVSERGQVHFSRLRMKPGKPCTFATVETEAGRRLVFGLPGNPVSSLVTFYLLALPALHKLAGRRDHGLRRVQAHLAGPLRLDPERPEYHRARVVWDVALNGGAGGWLAASTGNQASSRLLSLHGANALLELPQAQGELPAGSVVPALLIE